MPPTAPPEPPVKLPVPVLLTPDDPPQLVSVGIFRPFSLQTPAGEVIMENGGHFQAVCILEIGMYQVDGHENNSLRLHALHAKSCITAGTLSPNRIRTRKIKS